MENNVQLRLIFQNLNFSAIVSGATLILELKNMIFTQIQIPPQEQELTLLYTAGPYVWYRIGPHVRLENERTVKSYLGDGYAELWIQLQTKSPNDSIVTATPNVVGTNVFQSENQIALNCASSGSQTIADCELDVAMETDIRQCNAEVGYDNSTQPSIVWNLPSKSSNDDFLDSNPKTGFSSPKKAINSQISDIKVIGPGINEGVCGLPCVFYVELRNISETNVKLIGPNAEMCLPDNESIKRSGPYEYTPHIDGSFKAIFESNGEVLKEFNVQVSTKDELEQQRPKVNIKELPSSCGIREQIKFRVGIPREETTPTKSFVVKVYGPEFDQVECELKELTRDSRECTFTPTQEGKHYVSVVINRVAVEEWPFIVNVYRGGVKGFLDAPTTSPYFDYNVPATDNSDSEEGEEHSEGSYWFRWQSPPKDENDHCYVGLVNQGMTCYMNALLQTLYMIPEFRNGIYRNKNAGASSFTQLLQKFFVRLQISKSKAIAPKSIANFLGVKFGRGGDPESLLRLVLKTLNDEQNIHQSDSNQTGTTFGIGTLFRGKSIDYIRCAKCNNGPSFSIPFDILNLAVMTPKGRPYKSLTEALESYISQTTLSGYACDACIPGHSSIQDALKGQYITAFPHLLVFHVKTSRSFSAYKLNEVNLSNRSWYPEKLDLEEYLYGRKDGDEHMYELVAILVQSGTLSFGHAFAYIKHNELNKWFCFNDTSVSKTSLNNIWYTHGSCIYMLIYRKHSTSVGSEKFIRTKELATDPDFHHLHEYFTEFFATKSATEKKNSGKDKKASSVKQSKKHAKDCKSKKHSNPPDQCVVEMECDSEINDAIGTSNSVDQSDKNLKTDKVVENKLLDKNQDFGRAAGSKNKKTVDSGKTVSKERSSSKKPQGTGAELDMKLPSVLSPNPLKPRELVKIIDSNVEKLCQQIDQVFNIVDPSKLQPIRDYEKTRQKFLAESSNFGRFVATVEMGESLDFLQKIIAYLNSVYVTIWTRENEGFIPNGTAKTLRKNVYSRLGIEQKTSSLEELKALHRYIKNFVEKNSYYLKGKDVEKLEKMSNQTTPRIFLPDLV